MVLYQVAVLIHLLAAITWVGGILFLAMVMVPLVRREMVVPWQRSQFLGRVGLRFRPVGWACMALLVVTGAYLASQQWGIDPSDFFTSGGWFVTVLQVKVGLSVAVISLSALHDFVLGPRLVAQLPLLADGGEEPTSLRAQRRRVVWLARANLALVLAIVVLAVMLTRGSPI